MVLGLETENAALRARLDDSSLQAALRLYRAQLEAAVRETIAASAVPLTFTRIGSMFCLFFTAGPVFDLATAKRSDREAFGRFFRGCLDAGVYIAPSQFETGFISTAHQPEDIARTADVMSSALRMLE